MTPTRLLAIVASHPGYWAWAYDQYAVATGDARPPHEVLGCDRATADRLALYLLPRTDHLDADLAVTAADLGIAAEALRRVVAVTGGRDG